MLCYLLSAVFVFMGTNNPTSPEILPVEKTQEEIKSEDSDTILQKVGLGRKRAFVPFGLEILPIEAKNQNYTDLGKKSISDGSLLDIRFAELEDKFDKEDEENRDDLAGQLIINTLVTFEQMGIDLEDVD